MSKTPAQITGIRLACAIWKNVRTTLTEMDLAGRTTKELDSLIGSIIAEHHATPTFLNYHGFTGNACISINEQLIHGVPSDRVVKSGDMVTFDVGVTYEGYVCDAAFTVLVGSVDEKVRRINDVTLRSLEAAIAVVRHGVTTGTIGSAVQRVVQNAGYQVVKDFTGHGCGVKLHEPPTIPNYGVPGMGETVKENEVICIEPMVLTNSDKYVIDPQDRWTVSSTDQSLTCHWEHMVLVTKEGCEVLTR